MVTNNSASSFNFYSKGYHATKHMQELLAIVYFVEVASVAMVTTK